MIPERGATGWRAGLRAAALDGRAPLALAAAFLLLELFFLDRLKIPGYVESFFCEVAYHLNPDFNGRMAPDLPWGLDWSLGVGRIFLLVHHLFYRIFGLGIYSCRLVSYVCNLLHLFLIYRWARVYFDPTIARLSVFFLAVSAPLWFLTNYNGNYYAMIGLFSFLSFFFLSRVQLEGRARDAFGAGLCSGLAVDVHYRCVIIVLATWVSLLLSNRKGERRLWLALGAGSLLAFAWWTSLNVLPVGLHNYLTIVMPMAAKDGGDFSWSLALPEFRFFVRLATRLPGALDTGLWLLLIPLALRAPRPQRERRPLATMLRWHAVLFVSFSILERSIREDITLFYAPYLSILCALGFRRLSEKRPSWSIGLWAAVLLFVVSEYSIFLYRHSNLDTAAYYQKLRAAVRPGSVVLGSVHYWFAFPDQPYYGGPYYLNSLSYVQGELGLPQELKLIVKYSSSGEAYVALLKVLKKRNIEFVIGCEHLKSCLELFAPGGVLPPKNFALIATIEDPYLGRRGLEEGDGRKFKASYTTRIYRLVSYEP